MSLGEWWANTYLDEASAHRDKKKKDPASLKEGG